MNTATLDRPGKGHRFINISGQRFGRLVALSRSITSATRVSWDCVCDCGNRLSVVGGALRSGNTKSCGCGKAIANMRTHTTHGHARSSGDTRAYMIWGAMLRRCHSETHKDYGYYGARGIRVCDSWRKSFATFLSDMGEPEKGMTLDRKENNEGYSPSNCVWASRMDQSNNTRNNLMIQTPSSLMTLAEFSRETGINYSNLRAKLKRGVSIINGIEIKSYRRGEIA